MERKERCLKAGAHLQVGWGEARGTLSWIHLLWARFSKHIFSSSPKGYVMLLVQMRKQDRGLRNSCSFLPWKSALEEPWSGEKDPGKTSLHSPVYLTRVLQSQLSGCWVVTGTHAAAHRGHCPPLKLCLPEAQSLDASEEGHNRDTEPARCS